MDTSQTRPFDESPRFWGAIGIIFNIVPAVVVAMTKNLLWLFLIAPLFSPIVCYEMSKSCCNKGWLRALITTSGLMLSSIMFIFIWYFIKSPEIYTEFKSAYEEYQERLGVPLANVATSYDANEAWTENAHLIWISDVGIICAFPAPDRESYLCDKDPRSTDSKYNDPNQIRKLLHLEQNEYAPKGGFAYYLINEPNKWGWVGKVKNACDLKGEVHFQKFSGGRIYGPFPTLNEEGARLQFLIITMPDGEWKSVSVSEPKAQKCDPITF